MSLVSLLRDLAARLNGAEGLESVCRAAVDAAMRVAGMHCGWISLINKETGFLELICHQGLSAKLVREVLDRNCELFRTRILEKSSPHFTSIGDKTHWVHDIASRAFLRSLAVIPIWHAEQALGCLAVGSTSSEELTISRRQSLEAVAFQTGSAVARVSAEQALRDREQECGSVVEDQTELECHHLPDGTVVFANEAYCRYLGRMPEDLIGTRFLHGIAKADQDRVAAELAELGPDRPETSLEFQVIGPGGELRWQQWNHRAIFDEQGRTMKLQSVGRDITERKSIEQMKSDFVTTAAHELRTPLTSILGFSELLSIRDDISSEERNRYLGYIRKHAQNMANIINDLLDISRIESGTGLPMKPTLWDLRLTIAEILQSYQEQSSIHRFKSILPESAVEVLADKWRMTKLLNHIIDNAVKYSPAGGLIQVTCESLADHYLFSIEDQGKGMKPGQVQRIFDAFYRADASNTAMPGTGLGMTVAREIVQAQGGRIWVESDYGKGTTVRFTLPIRLTVFSREGSDHEEDTCRG
ncbi:MAG: PAS domain S-box protein [Deltaproteobacteria bacterium]|nr:PAS domain S-box protein [Deltaproteobacteria bacterium]